MDDLAMLREMRADTPQPGAERMTAMQARLVRTTRRDAERAFLDRFSRPALLAGAAALMAVIVLTSLVSVRSAGTSPGTADGGSTPPRYAATTTVLEEAALVAEARPTTVSPRPHQWQYTKTLDKQALAGPGEETVQESWIRYDGKKAAGYTAGGKVHVSDIPPDPGDDDLPPVGYARKLRALPTDPGKLLTQVSGDRHWIDFPKQAPPGYESPDQRAFRVLSTYLRQQAVMPPKVEAAIYRALARIPGVEVEMDVDDGTGRKGLGVFKADPKDTAPLTRSYLILKPGSFRYLGSRMVWLRDDRSDPAHPISKGRSWVNAVLASGIVNEPGQRP
jgi:hypothetical protein